MNHPVGIDIGVETHHGVVLQRNRKVRMK